MVVKVYVSGISGNKEVKKRQQRVLMILDSKCIKYDVIDITEPGCEAVKDFMQNNAKSNGGTVSDPNPRSPLPPQLFNDEEYCGDYDLFDLANEVDTLEQFLKLEAPPEEPPQNDIIEETKLNGDVHKDSKENSQERENGADNTSKANVNTTDEQTNETKEKSPIADAKDEETSEKQASEKESSPEKEPSVEKEASVEKEDPVEKEASVEKETSVVQEAELESKKASKENTPDNTDDVNENGTVSSREQSQPREAGDVTKEKVDDPSLALIESEQAAAE